MGVGRITGIGEKASVVPRIGTAALALTADAKLDASRLAVWVAGLTATTGHALTRA